MKLSIITVVAGAIGAAALFFALDCSETIDAKQTTPCAKKNERTGVAATGRETHPHPHPHPHPGLQIDSLRKSIASENLSENPVVIEAEYNRLCRLLEENPDFVYELLKMFKNETDPDMLDVISQVIAENPMAAGNPEVVRAMMAFAQNDASPVKRHAALSVLAQIPELTPDVRELVARVSREDTSDEVRIAAISAMGWWATNHPEATESICLDLVGTIQSSGKSEVRGNAIQTIALQDDRIPKEVLPALSELLKTEENPQNRALAAMALGGVSAENRQTALAALEQALTQETHPETQKSILMQIVRVSGSDALARLEDLQGKIPALSHDIRDYIEIIQSGVTDPSKIFEAKFERDSARAQIDGANDHNE